MIKNKYFNAKKQIERIQFEGDIDKLLDEVNKAWEKWAPKEGSKIIETEVMKQVKDKESIVYITANLLAGWKMDEVNKLNVSIDKKGIAYITFNAFDFVINIGFADDVDASKYSRRLNGMRNSAIHSKEDLDIVGTYDKAIGENNLEIRESLFITIDKK